MFAKTKRNKNWNQFWKWGKLACRYQQSAIWFEWNRMHCHPFLHSVIIIIFNLTANIPSMYKTLCMRWPIKHEINVIYRHRQLFNQICDDENLICEWKRVCHATCTMHLFIIIIIVIDIEHSLLNSNGSSIKKRQTTTFHSWIEINAIHHHYSPSKFRSKNVNIRFVLFRCFVLYFFLLHIWNRFRVGAPLMNVAPMLK